MAERRGGEPGGPARKEPERSTLASAGWSWMPGEVPDGELDC